MRLDIFLLDDLNRDDGNIFWGNLVGNVTPCWKNNERTGPCSIKSLSDYLSGNVFPRTLACSGSKLELRYLVDKALFQPRSQGSFSSHRARRRSADIFLKIITTASSSLFNYLKFLYSFSTSRYIGKWNHVQFYVNWISDKVEFLEKLMILISLFTIFFL